MQMTLDVLVHAQSVTGLAQLCCPSMRLPFSWALPMLCLILCVHQLVVWLTLHALCVLQRLLEGRINQLKGTVIITKCANRTFAAAQWRELRDQLAAWKVAFHISILVLLVLAVAA